jgi:hypothetical protein
MVPPLSIIILGRSKITRQDSTASRTSTMVVGILVLGECQATKLKRRLDILVLLAIACALQDLELWARTVLLPACPRSGRSSSSEVESAMYGATPDHLLRLSRGEENADVPVTGNRCLKMGENAEKVGCEVSPAPPPPPSANE